MPLVTTTRGASGWLGNKPERVAGVQHQGLLVGHFGQVFHGEAVLRPVLEHRAVAAVGDEFVRVFGHLGVEVVLHHQHDGRRLFGAMRIVADGPGEHGVIGPEAVHVDAAVALQFFGEFGRQHGVVPGIEIAQGVADGQFFLLIAQHPLDDAFGRMGG
jgi:hypothetical protein